MFNDCCNEFWWICTYVAKGIWRDEVPYAMCMYDRFLRDMLFEMINWYIGIKTDFTISVGKCGKHFKKYLEAEIWDMTSKLTVIVTMIIYGKHYLRRAIYLGLRQKRLQTILAFYIHMVMINV